MVLKLSTLLRHFFLSLLFRVEILTKKFWMKKFLEARFREKREIKFWQNLHFFASSQISVTLKRILQNEKFS